MAIVEGEARASDICAPLTTERRSVDALQSMSQLVTDAEEPVANLGKSADLKVV